MPTDKSKKPKISKAEFARELGLTPQNLNYHLNTGKAPPVGDLDAWMTYLAGEGREGTLPKKLREAIANERLKLLKQAVSKATTENEEKRGELIPFASVEKYNRRLIGELFFGELERLANEFPASLKGQDEAAIHIECKKNKSKKIKRQPEGLHKFKPVA